MRKHILILGLFLALLFTLGGFTLAAHAEKPNKPKPSNGPAPKVVVCHATGSASNPYVRNVISENGLNGHFRDGHQQGEDIINPPGGVCPGPTTPEEPEEPETPTVPIPTVTPTDTVEIPTVTPTPGDTDEPSQPPVQPVPGSPDDNDPQTSEKTVPVAVPTAVAAGLAAGDSGDEPDVFNVLVGLGALAVLIAAVAGFFARRR